MLKRTEFSWSVRIIGHSSTKTHAPTCTGARLRNTTGSAAQSHKEKQFKTNVVVHPQPKEFQMIQMLLLLPHITAQCCQTGLANCEATLASCQVTSSSHSNVAGVNNVHVCNFSTLTLHS